MKRRDRLLYCPLVLVIFLCLASACKRGSGPVPETPSGTIQFSIEHRVDGALLELNDLVYTNAAGNEYLVSDLMYFISDITLYRNNGTHIVIGAQKDIFYIDERIPTTKTIQFADKIPAGTYDSITFIFGISEVKNKSFIFVNPPEVLMGWPEVLGGGYHYMMMNGKWKDTNEDIQPFNFHLGIGQLYKGNTYNVDSIYAFVHNCFTVHLPGSSFKLADKELLGFRLTMNIGKWFETPHVYDFNYWGGAIMQNQAALQVAKENGWDVFSIVKIQ